jgi:hypothetical protein
MISLRQLLEQIDLPQPENTEDGFDANVNDTSAELDNGTITLETYIDKLTQHFNSTSNTSQLNNQIILQVSNYFNKSTESIKQRLYNDIGSINAAVTDVDTMNTQLQKNIYLTDPELVKAGMDSQIGAGEFSFIAAYTNALWAGLDQKGNFSTARTATGDAIITHEGIRYIIDVKDEKKIGGAPGVDIGNKSDKDAKLFFDNTKFLELQKKVEMMLRFLRMYDNHRETINLFSNNNVANIFDDLRNSFIDTMYNGDYTYEQWLRKMQTMNRENGIKILDNSPELQRMRHLLVIAEKGATKTLEFQCFLNKLKTFINKYSNDINDTKLGVFLKKIIYDEVFQPYWFIHALQAAVKIGDGYTKNMKYDYVLIADKTGKRPPYYFSFSKEDGFPVSLYARRGMSDIGGGPDALIMNVNKYVDDYIDVITFNDLSEIDPCDYLDKKLSTNQRVKIISMLHAQSKNKGNS